VLRSQPLAAVCEHLDAGGRVRLNGVWGSSAPLLGAAMGIARSAPVLFLCTHLDEADAIADDVEVLTGRPATLFPAWEAEEGALGAGGIPPNHVSDEVVGERLNVCSRLARAKWGQAPFQTDEMEPVPILVAPIAALMQPVPSLEALKAAGLTLEKGGQVDPERLAEWLVEAGFDHVEQVDQQGEFARRGGIVDIFAPGTDQPVRVEFFGDEVDSIRQFDLDTQRSMGEMDGYELVATSAGRQTERGKTTTLLEYLPAGTVVCLLEPVEVAALAEALYRRLGSASGIFSPKQLFESMAPLATAEMFAFAPSGKKAGKKGQARFQTTEKEPVPFSMGIQSIQRLETNTAEAMAALEGLCEDNDVFVYCENPAERDRFGEILQASHPKLARKVSTAIGHVSRGFHWPELDLVVVGHHEVFHRHVPPRRLRRVRTGRPIDSFVDLQEGDYVVHVSHGIARFEGLRTLEKAGRKEEYLTLRFADHALLHVPVTEIQLVQKYIGARRGHPTLSKLGGKAWSARKARVAEAVEDMAAELLRIQAVRASSPGVSFAGDSDWLRQFEGEFPYEETEDQLTAMDQIGRDMVEARPMDRLLCGDVGYGKTELAMRAAFRVVEAGKQVAVLVPTTVLADQHYRTFRERMADYPFRVDVISRFRTKADQGRIVSAAAAGGLDVLIGTHRLLSEDVRFNDLGLVVIDEEQRFGVEHKERFKRMRATVDVLTLTATPIPRTLHMTMLGLRDISSLTTAPLDRRAIYTEVCQVNDERIRAAILRELDRGGQVFFVHNRVHDIESVADHVRGIVPDARVDVGHGQMPERRLEKTMLRFVRGEIDVLVCTTIIESGLDIPTANTMFVHEADRLGLAQLHQLRGRIGRYRHRAYCYLLLPERRPVSRVAAKRLKAVEEFSDLGAGFQIAMRDLEIRGAGNILGAEQSGHIAAVGYELYCQLLEQSVHRLRGEEVAPPPHCHVELGVEAYIPRSYVASGRQRMEVYRRMANCRTAADVEQLGKDLADAYGKVPSLVDDLLTVAAIRALASGLGVDAMVLHGPDVVFTVSDGDRSRRALEGLAGTVRMPDAHTAHWRPPPAYLEGPTLLTVLRRHLQKAASGR